LFENEKKKKCNCFFVHYFYAADFFMCIYILKKKEREKESQRRDRDKAKEIEEKERERKENRLCVYSEKDNVKTVS